MSQPDLTVQDAILDSAEKVYGIIYKITNTITGVVYVGQTVSHRKNKGKFRPFGMVGRFNDHISEAVNNTKKKQCSYLNNAIRKYGKDMFVVELLEHCPRESLDDREQYYIESLNTIFPNGYNLTPGGKTMYVQSFTSTTPSESPKKRGGCLFRSEETRKKMSLRGKEMVDDERRIQRSEHAKYQHLLKKMEKFQSCKIDLDKMDSYIRMLGTSVVVRIDGIETDFTSRKETLEQSKERAQQFIRELHNATLSNCGKPVKHEVPSSGGNTLDGSREILEVR